MSIASTHRKPGFNRSTSRYSSSGVSRPHSPIVFGPQVNKFYFFFFFVYFKQILIKILLLEVIFKMSDLSIDSGSSTPVNPPIVKPTVAKVDLPPLNLKKANERRGKFGKVKQGPHRS